MVFIKLLLAVLWKVVCLMVADGVNFSVQPEVERIFTEEDIKGLEDTMYNLELYKFSTRASLISAVNIAGVLPNLTLDKPELVRHTEFKETESVFGVLVEKQHNSLVMVYYPAGAKINKNAIELDLAKHDVVFTCLTPYNFKLLQFQGDSFVRYSPNILFKRILIEAVNLKATDLHFCVGHDGLKPQYPVKYRKDGNLYTLDLFKLDAALNKTMISKLVEQKTAANSADLITPAGVTATADDPLGNHALELRIAANKVNGGWHCVIRIQTKETFSFDIASLGFNEKTQKALHSVTKRRNGVVFITGAIRTGKNTTAFAILNEIVKEPVKIVSYESPIEVLMPFTQVDYAGDPEMLLNAVRLAKKQDVNIAYINELPNKEVAFAVQDLVNSSVCVLTTMHLNRLWHLPYKLKEYYGTQYKDVISQIGAVFNQKMFGVPCRECKDKKLVLSLDSKLQEFLKKKGAASVEVNRGCAVCNGTGLQPGRNQPYVEYLDFTPSLKDKLLQCDEPYQMETVLKEELAESNTSLESTMGNAVLKGALQVDALNDIL